MAKQFRVQVSSAETSTQWKLAGSFCDASAAGDCAANLRKSGKKTRIIACRSLPTAA